MFVAALPLARIWPDSLDKSSIALFIAVVLLVPAVGYFFMVADIRAYMRALRGALVVVRNYLPNMPAWARLETPPCLRALGLRAGCSEQDVKQAYRRHAEKLHPDLGGDRKRFMRLQSQFEASLRYVRENQTVFRSDSP